MPRKGPSAPSTPVAAPPQTEAPPLRARLLELGWLFLRLGGTAFGGPAAHIAMMEDEVVRRRAWLTREDFLDLLGAVNLIPGPNSTEMAIHLGHRRAGFAGLVTAGVCFIVPAVLLVTLIAWAYVRFGALPISIELFEGIKPVIIAVVLQALFGFAKTACKSVRLCLAGAASLLATALGVHELLVLLSAGLFMALLAAPWRRVKTGGPSCLPLFLAVPQALPGLPLAGSAAAQFGRWPLFLFFFKVGSVLFGSGYVLLAFLRADLVQRWHVLSQAQLIDAIAVGQFTPGPVFTTATFIGYLLGGVPSALIATLGIFLPAFVFVAVSAPLLPRLRRSRIAGAALDGVNVASLALMLSATYVLGRSAIYSFFTAGLALFSLILLVRFRVNSAWLVLFGGILGLVKSRGM
jgi:chromate transporter